LKRFSRQIRKEDAIKGAFDAVVFHLCGQRPVAKIAAELETKLKLGLVTKPPEEQIAAAKAWHAERRALLVLDDICANQQLGKYTGWSPSESASIQVVTA
jgi:hypothetical protein